MRKQPQEFGFGVRGVQASPVDTFSPEVVQKPRAARGQAVSQGLSNLSQTLAGMAQQNRQYDDSTLEPLANAVFELRKAGKTDAQIAKEVSESGMTSQRVLARIRKAGSFDAFTDPAFRITYDELQGDDAAVAAEASFAALDNVARDMWAGISVDSDVEQVAADIEAMYARVAEEHAKGLSPFGLSAFRKRAEVSVQRRVAEARAKGQRIQEQHYANLSVQRTTDPMSAFIEEDGDGTKMEESLRQVWKETWPNVAAPDQEQALLTYIDAASEALALADQQELLIPEDPEHADEIEEFIDAIEASMPEEAQAFSSVSLALTKLRKENTRTRMQMAAYRKSQTRLRGPEEFDLKLTAIQNLPKLSESEDLDELAYAKASAVVRSDIEALRGATSEELDALAEKYEVDRADLKQHLVKHLELYEKEKDAAKSERLGDEARDRELARYNRAVERDNRAEVEKRQQEKYDSLLLSIGAATDQKALDEAGRALASVAGTDQISQLQKQQLQLAFDRAQTFAPQRQAVANAAAGSVGAILEDYQTAYATDVDGDVDPNKKLPPGKVSRIRERLEQYRDQAILEITQEPNFRQNADTNPSQYTARVAARTRELFEQDEAMRTVEGQAEPEVGFSVMHGTVRPAGISMNTNGRYTPLMQETARQVLNGNMLQSALPSTDPNAAQELVDAGVKAVPGFEALPRVVDLIAQGEFIDLKGDKRKIRTEVRQLLKVARPLVDRAMETKDGRPTPAAVVARDMLEDFVLDSGVVSMETEAVDVVDALRDKMGGEDILADAKEDYRYNQEVSQIQTFFDDLAGVLDFGSTFTSADDALRVRLAEFQPTGKYYGIYNATEGRLNTKWSEGTYTFQDAVDDYGIWLESVTGRKPSYIEIQRGLISQSQIINDPTGAN